MEALAAIGGFAIGLITWNRSVYWLYSLRTVWLAQKGRFGPITAAIFLNSAPWLLALAIFVLWVARANATFPYLVAGMIAAPAVVLINLAFFLRRRRRARIQREQAGQ